MPIIDGLKPPQAEIDGAQLQLLGNIEASLKVTQNALLAGEVSCLEEATRQQVGLHRDLEILCERDAAMLANLADSGDLRAARMRVLQLGQVQIALLRRAGQRLRMISNLLAASADCNPAGTGCGPKRFYLNSPPVEGRECRA